MLSGRGTTLSLCPLFVRSLALLQGSMQAPTDPSEAAVFNRTPWWERPLKFRPVGSPAGSWHHTPWHTCVLWDPYERINFWSHFLPGVVFVTLAILSFRQQASPGAVALGIYSCCAAATHLFSALTHVWPDDHVLEKLDHVGIVALIAGTPLTALMVCHPSGGFMPGMAAAAAALVGAAFLRPLLRTLGFVAIGAVVFFVHWQMVNLNLLAQVVLYISGAVSFIRNGGHNRWGGWTDHHLLHYFVTVATILHVLYIRNGVAKQAHSHQP